jgi:hypothetical protein
MSLAAIHREVYDARAADRPITHIRVTTDALPGYPAAVPITPERARTIRLRMAYGGTVGADYASTGRLLEIVIHPEDWATLLKEKDALGHYAVGTDGRVKTVLGIPVAES